MNVCHYERNPCDWCGQGYDFQERQTICGPSFMSFPCECPNVQKRATTEPPQKHLNRIEPTKTDQKEL